MFIVNGVSGALLHCINFRVATDPACGSGNFLTETYLSLRRLENEALKEIGTGQIRFAQDKLNPVKVNIDQLYGIEINDFAVAVANTALIIAESQILKETEEILNANIEFLPLQTFKNIHEGNALRMDWNEVLPADECSYICGNPPFRGARLMNKTQKDDLISVFGKNWKHIGDLDYVSGWFKKAVEYLTVTDIKASFVSTDSIAQGMSVSNLWQPLFNKGININFAHTSFKWMNETRNTAAVFCVIIGFSYGENGKPKYIFTQDSFKKVNHINGYLVEGENIVVSSRNKPICPVPDIGIGNKPIDGGFYLFTEEEKDEFIKHEPRSKKYFHPWYGAREFIHSKPRYCLWLGDCSPKELKSMPMALERVRRVKEYRQRSKSAGTRKLAEKPTKFHVENFPKTDCIVIPEISSDQRKYIPVGFMGSDVICSNRLKIVNSASLYYFGILTSNVHNAWIRTIAGRLGSGYSYSNQIVYNNFPWPKPDSKQKALIEKTAQNILDMRAKYPDSSLADLYDETLMPPDLRKAHQANDKAVMQAYGWNWRNMTEEDCVAELMKLYQEMTQNK